jgi:hypothetical protein
LFLLPLLPLQSLDVPDKASDNFAFEVDIVDLLKPIPPSVYFGMERMAQWKS